MYKACVGDAMGFLSMLIEHCGNDKAVQNGINYTDKKTGHTPLTYYIMSKRANKKGLKILLSFDTLDVKKVKFGGKNVLQLAQDSERKDFAALLDPYFAPKK